MKYCMNACTCVRSQPHTHRGMYPAAGGCARMHACVYARREKDRVTSMQIRPHNHSVIKVHC